MSTLTMYIFLTIMNLAGIKQIIKVVAMRMFSVHT